MIAKDDDGAFWRHVRKFLTVFLPNQRRLSQNTIFSYKYSLSLFCQFLKEQRGKKLEHVTYRDLTKDNVNDFLQWLLVSRTNSISTCNLRLTALKSFLRYAANDDISIVTVFMDIKKIQVMKDKKTKVEYLSKKGLKILVDQPNTKTTKGIRNKVMIIMLYDTATRINELLSLKLKDLNFSGRNPYISIRGKGNKLRYLPLMDKTLTHLRSYLKIFHPGNNANDGDRYLFYSMIHSTPCRLSTDTVALFLKKYGEAAAKACSDIPDRVHPHLVRHTRATHLYQDGMPLSYIAEFLGHASIDTTRIYASPNIEMMRDALMRVEDPVADAKPNYKTTDMLEKLCGL